MDAPTTHPSSDAQPVFERIAIGEIQPESYQEILGHWCDQRGGRAFPLRQQIDPFVVPTLAANIILFEVQDGRLIYRVLGERVITALKTDIRGKSPKEAFGDTPYIRMIEQQLLACAARGIPIYSCHDFRLEDPGYGSQSRKAWRIALPYGDDGCVSRLLCYQQFSTAIEFDYRQDINYEKLLPQTVFEIQV